MPRDPETHPDLDAPDTGATDGQAALGAIAGGIEGCAERFPGDAAQRVSGFAEVVRTTSGRRPPAQRGMAVPPDEAQSRVRGRASARGTITAKRGPRSALRA